ncbi:RNA polymerase II transcription factor B subunit 2 [Neoconidiobolus thromboides FSU 785]|nr:RNA polymerase II transcription factor B subunit 2 [Neoconidiobolus thromboides FSU 785]
MRYNELHDNIQSYLFSLNSRTFSKLFKEPSSCLAIYRLLTPLAKQLVMSLLFSEDQVEITTVFSWFHLKAAGEVQIALKNAAKLKILIKSKSKPGDSKEQRDNDKKYIHMNRIFRSSFKNALCGGCSDSSFGKSSNLNDKIKPSIEILDRFAEKSREAILHYMVGSRDGEPVSPKVVNLLRNSGLMSKKEGDTKITNRGFQFLLKDVVAQTWIFLLQYLSMVSSEERGERKIEQVEVLQFYFLLASLEFGKGYLISALNPAQRKMLHDLSKYGVIYQNEEDPKMFYPTLMATSLMSGGLDSTLRKGDSPLEAPDELKDELNILSGQPGTLIVETNYRIYAYTKSQLQVAILNLFMGLKNRYENMVAGYLDRDSVRKAFSHGITADQIIHYLESHAHPIMRKENPILPLTVVDQIKLWEIEKNRVHSSSGKLWKGFARPQDFIAVYEIAKSYGGVLWANREKKMMVITESAHAYVKEEASAILGIRNGK